MLGHVDHGKTTLTKALTGKWTDTHSEEIKRGISIRLGYADATIYKCTKCKKYVLKEKCYCGGKAEFIRKISIVDAPGHETLMTTVIAASSILDGAIFLIAANEVCPQPQTSEHLIVLNSTGIKNIVVVQTKVDLVSKEKALESYKQIKTFLKGSVAQDAPIVPVAANYGLNMDELINAIEKTIPNVNRDLNATPVMYVSRSFDVNKPGTKIKDIGGGVLGGSIIKGKLKLGQTIEIKPGIVRKEGAKATPITCEILSLREENESLKEATPGGLIAVGTSLDPSLTKSDAFVGSVIGLKGTLADAISTFNLKVELLKRVDILNPPLKDGETLAINCYTATSVGVIAQLSKGGIATIKSKKALVAQKGSRIAISRKIGNRWRLGGWGTVV